jgi:glutathione S-transferase
MRIKLYETQLSPYVLKVKVVLFEKGVEFESETVDLTAEEQKGAAFLKMNPFHRVPVLQVGTAFLFESTAINEYLEEKYPKPPLLPADHVLRAEARAWEEVGDAYLGPVLGGLVQQNLNRPEGPAPAAVEELKKKAAEVLVALDAKLEGRDYVAALFSLADIGLAIQVSALGMFGVALEGYANIGRWLGTITARESVRRAMPSAEVMADLMSRAGMRR